MKAGKGRAAGACVSLVIILLGSIPVAYTAASPYDITTFTAIGPPFIATSTNAGSHTITYLFQMRYQNNANATLTADVYFVFRNPLGQAVFWNMSAITLTTSQSALAEIPLRVSVADDVVWVFVVSQSGIALSSSTVMNIPA